MDSKQLKELVIACQNPAPDEPWVIQGVNSHEKMELLAQAIIILEKVSYHHISLEQALEEWEKQQ